MKIRKTIEPPCSKCPYSLGRVKFIQNPCLDCKKNNYQMYYVLIERHGSLQEIDKDVQDRGG